MAHLVEKGHQIIMRCIDPVSPFRCLGSSDQTLTLPAIGGHCTSAAVLIGCHAQRNGPIESNGEILKYHSCGFIIDVSLFSTIKIDVLIHFKIISQIRSSLKIVETPPNKVL